MKEIAIMIGLVTIKRRTVMNITESGMRGN